MKQRFDFGRGRYEKRPEEIEARHAESVSEKKMKPYSKQTLKEKITGYFERMD